MILPLYAVGRPGSTRELREASADLGGSRFTTFPKVTLPLTLPGVVTGCIFVFVPSLGNFVVPELLGGGKTVMVGNLVRDQFLKARDWPFGATLALFMVVLLVLLFALQSVVEPPLLPGGAPMRRERLGWLWVALGGCPAFLYLPIATLVVTVVQQRPVGAEPHRPRRRSGTASCSTTSDLGEALVNSLLVALGATVFVDRAGHHARRRPGAVHPVDGARRVRDGAGDPARPGAGHRPAVLLRAGRAPARPGHRHPRARRLRHGVRGGGGATAPACSSTAPWRRRRRTSAPAG